MVGETLPAAMGSGQVTVSYQVLPELGRKRATSWPQRTLATKGARASMAQAPPLPNRISAWGLIRLAAKEGRNLKLIVIGRSAGSTAVQVERQTAAGRASCVLGYLIGCAPLRRRTRVWIDRP